MSVTVKRGDKYPITFTANADLTGATVRLLATLRHSQDPAVVLSSTVTDPPNGVVTHTLDGMLEVGVYNVELEVSRESEVVTFPTGDGKPAYEALNVVDDLG